MADEIIKQQIIRKNNLKKVIEQQFNGKIEDFADSLQKNKYFVYGLLWDVNKRSSRNITEKTARLIEKHLHMPDGFLDQEEQVDDTRVVFIPYINISNSEAYEYLSYSPEFSLGISRNELISNNLSPSTLLAVKIFDDSMLPNFDIGDIIVIDQSKTDFIANKLYLIYYKKQYIIRKISRDIDSGGIKISPTNTMKIITDFEEYIIQDIKDLEIIGAAIMKINFIKGI